MKALVLNCTLKASPETSSTEALARVVMQELADGGPRPTWSAWST